MIAAQLIATHNATMECYRRAIYAWQCRGGVASPGASTTADELARRDRDNPTPDCTPLHRRGLQHPQTPLRICAWPLLSPEAARALVKRMRLPRRRPTTAKSRIRGFDEIKYKPLPTRFRVILRMWNGRHLLLCIFGHCSPSLWGHPESCG
jgi:hypothetical protein